MASYTDGVNCADTGFEDSSRLYGPGVVRYDLGKDNGNLIRSGTATQVSCCLWMQARPGIENTPTTAQPFTPSIANHWPFIGFSNSLTAVMSERNLTNSPVSTAIPVIGCGLAPHTGNNLLLADSNEGLCGLVVYNHAVQAALGLAGAGATIARTSGDSQPYQHLIANHYPINAGSAGKTFVHYISMQVISTNVLRFTHCDINLGTLTPADAKAAMNRIVHGEAFTQRNRERADITTGSGVTAKQFMAMFPFLMFQWSSAVWPLFHVHMESWVSE